jgi:hypothetical protein
MNTKSKYEELKPHLKRGDAIRLAKLTGYSVITVRRMLQGQRTLHPLVLAAIEKLVEYRIKGIDEKLTTIK